MCHGIATVTYKCGDVLSADPERPLRPYFGYRYEYCDPQYDDPEKALKCPKWKHTETEDIKSDCQKCIATRLQWADSTHPKTTASTQADTDSQRKIEDDEEYTMWVSSAELPAKTHVDTEPACFYRYAQGALAPDLEPVKKEGKKPEMRKPVKTKSEWEDKSQLPITSLAKNVLGLW